MNVIEYVEYFHDGNLFDIKHRGNELFIFLESSQIDPDEIHQKNILSKNNTLRGKLCFAGIKLIKKENIEYEGVLNKEYDDGEILDLEIYSDRVILLIEWKNFPPKKRITDISKVEIEAEKIWWENIPDLFDRLK